MTTPEHLRSDTLPYPDTSRLRAGILALACTVGLSAAEQADAAPRMSIETAAATLESKLHHGHKVAVAQNKEVLA